MPYRANLGSHLVLVALSVWKPETMLTALIIQAYQWSSLFIHELCHSTAKLVIFQVLRLKVKEGLITDMTEVFADDGTLISGSSVALYAKNKLFIGSVFTQTIVCDVQYIWYKKQYCFMQVTWPPVIMYYCMECINKLNKMKPRWLRQNHLSSQYNNKNVWLIHLKY